MILKKDPILLNTEFGEYYYANGNIFPRVTSVFHGFQPCRKSNWTPDAATLGTMLHYLILSQYKDQYRPETHIWKVEQDDVYEIRRSALCMWRKIRDGIKVLEVELPVCHYYPNYAGRLDMICEMDEELYVGDIKTGNWYDYYDMQLSAYYQAAKRASVLQGRKIKGVAFFRLDINLERNPEQVPAIVVRTLDELIEPLKGFNLQALEFNEHLNRYIAAHNIDIAKLAEEC
jgi:hypothetical protein